MIFNGNNCIAIHVKFTMNNLKDATVYVYAYFYNAENTIALQDPYGNSLSLYKAGTSSYDSARFNDFVLYMPYVSLNMPNGWNGTLSFDISIKDASGKQLARRNNTQFSVIM